MQISKLFLTIVLVLFGAQLPAWGDPGGWISSGGEVFKNAKNPWFVKNTQVVSYCVEFSASEFSTDLTSTLKLIEQSLTYWKYQLDGEAIFSKNSSDGLAKISSANVALATQEFRFNAICSGKEELVFKFGYQTLDKDEKAKLLYPEKYLGVTIRKDYNEETLKGSGIIFISGDLGPNSYGKTSSDVISEAWKHAKLLQYVIMHELGHVFGLPHSGSGLMSEVFLDQLLIRKFAALYVREPLLPTLKPYESIEICDDSLLPVGSQQFLEGFFSLKYKEDCLKLESLPNQKEYSILTKKVNKTSWSKIGTLYVDKNELVDFSLKPAVVLQLNDRQKIFPNPGSTFLVGPLYQNYKVDGHINFGSSLRPIPVQIDLSPDSLVIYSQYQNRIRQVFSFGSPLLFNLLKPF